MKFRQTFPFALLLLAACSSIEHAKPDNAEIDVHELPIATVKAMAIKGDREAIHDLCYRYTYGRNASKDYAEALVWCTNGAELGIDSSQTLLAEIYYSGHGVPVDYPTARRWYGAAADQGHEHALLMLYYMHKEGTGVPADQVIADRALKLAVDAGYGPALKVQAEIEGARNK